MTRRSQGVRRSRKKAEIKELSASRRKDADWTGIRKKRGIQPVTLVPPSGGIFFGAAVWLDFYAAVQRKAALFFIGTVP